MSLLTATLWVDVSDCIRLSWLRNDRGKEKQTARNTEQAVAHAYIVVTVSGQRVGCLDPLLIDQK